jgi:predicted 2-oxoglutarate/Fe(II)-dependent dioxygenase YbiX
MIIFPVACILFGCLQDVPIDRINSAIDNPVRAVQTAMPRKTTKPKMACYVEGVFYVGCPK